MRASLAFVALLAACSSSTDGPVPVVASVMPDPVCDAQGMVTLTITGTGFSPIVKDALTSTPSVVMPAVRLVGASPVDVPAADISTPDTTGTKLVVTIEQSSVPPGTYDVEVTDPDGHTGTLAGGLVVDPPPDLVSVSPTFGIVGQTVMITLTGTGFRDTMTVTLAATPPVPCTNVVVTPDGTMATCTLNLTGVATGSYDLVVDNLDGCTSTLVKGFAVVTEDFALSGIDPPFGCQCSDTPVTISTTGGEFVSTPQVQMRPAGQATPVYLMKRVAFVDGNTLTAVVPAGLPLGPYDVTVVNPPTNGRLGTLANAFRVVSMPVPVIEQVVPDRAPPSTVVNATIYGNNFRAAAKVELLDRTGVVAATATAVTVNSATQITTTFTTPATQDAYLVRVTDLDQNTYSTWSAFIVGAEGASGNLHMFTTSSTLVTGRRMLGGVSARDDLGNSFIYGIGGDTGAGGTVLDTVEVAQLSKFGALGGWKQEKASNSLLHALDAPAAVAVPIFGTDPFIPTKTYIYVTGGNTGAAVVGEVERAVVLRNADAPVITGSGPSATAGSLAAGTWYYKVSAVLGADPDNPNGETLPSDEAIVTLAAGQTAIDLTWNPVTVNAIPAAHYRIYRTKMVDGVSQQELFLEQVDTTSFTDDGTLATTTEPPLPPGSLGVWQQDTHTIDMRWGHQAAVITDDQGAVGGRSLYVLGGKSDAMTGYLATIQHAPIDATGHIGAFTTTGTTALPTAMAFFSLVVETPQNVKGFTGARLITLGGVDAGGSSGEIEQSTITSGGGNGAWAVPFMNASLLTRAGPMAVIASDKLWVLGGAAMATATTFMNVRSNGEDVAFDNAGALVAPLQSAANILPSPRALAVPITGSGFIYVVGGSSDGSNATNTCYQTF